MSIVCSFLFFSIHGVDVPLIEKYLTGFQFGAVMNKSSRSIRVPVFTETHASFLPGMSLGVAESPANMFIRICPFSEVGFL